MRLAGFFLHGVAQMASIFARLFGAASGRKDESAAAGTAEAVSEYKGYAIRPAPRRQGSDWLLAGVISKDFSTGPKEHHFVRSDTFGAHDEAVAFTITKAKQIIDEQGDRMFGPG